MHTLDQSVLIVENDDPTRELYVRELSRDYRAFACTTEHEVLDLLRTHTIDAIVLEPSQPNGLGWQLLSTIQAATAAHHVPVIVCSTLDERLRGIELGVSVYLVKPVLPKTLVETVRRLLSSHT
jgi:DNA-binding response OmpR family regulator